MTPPYRPPGWYLSRVGERCGNCFERVLALTPMRQLASGGRRCEACALKLLNETPPADLMVNVPPTPTTPSTPINGVRSLQPFVTRFRQQVLPDLKARAAGESADSDERKRPDQHDHRIRNPHRPARSRPGRTRTRRA